MVPDPWGNEVSFFGQPTSFPWHVLVFALVLVATSVAPIRRALSWQPLVALGAASFSIYLVHQPVIAVVAAQAGPGGGAVAVAALAVVGFAFWWCIERPLTDSARRRRVRERLLPAVARVLGSLGVPRTLLVDPALTRGGG
jgi:peptidoglycan/LPS O-acetylase OafA/YrhL